jgi:PAS domain S-box-containing protein
MNKGDFARLRKKAEAKLTADDRRMQELGHADLAAAAHELAVHQVELEIQNEELKQSRITAEEARDRYLDLFDSAPVGYFMLDERNRIIEANKTGRALLDVKTGSLKNTRFTKFITDEETDNFYLYQKSVQANDTNSSLDLKMKKADGSLFYAHIESVKTGEKGLRITVSDISARKEIEHNLETTRTGLQNILNSIKDGFFALDNNFTVTYYNPAAEQMLGRKAADVLGKNLFTAFPEAKGSIFETNYNLVLKEQKPILFETYFGVQPLENWYDVRAFPAEEGIVVFFQVTTERKKVEHALQASEKRFREMFEKHQATMLLIDPLTGKILDGNNAAAEFYCYPREALKKMKIGDINQLPAEKVAANIQKAVATNLKREIFPHKLANGEIRTVEVSSTPIDMNKRKVLFSIIQDVTDREQAAYEISRLNQTLSQRASELEAANKELEQFSYSVSHDLRAPLRSLEGFSKILLEDYAQVLDAEGKENLQRIITASRDMSHLINDLLTLSHATQIEIHLETVNLSRLAEQVAAELKTQNPDRKVDFKIAPDLAALGDEHLLKLVFDNMLGNAFKFTGKAAHGKIEFGATAIAGETVYFVRDNGAGFNMEYANKLFKPFQRLHPQSEFPGTGIGLASVQNIIRRLGGKIWVEAEVNHGATFYFTLKQVAPKAAKHV